MVIKKWKWSKTSQPGELRFHQRNLFRQTSGFMEETEAIFAGLGFSQESLAGKRVLDFGAGSKLRTLWFRDVAELVALELLASEFARTIKWSDLSKADNVLAVAGEDFVDSYRAYFDVSFSVNVLDHAHNWKRALRNNHRYLNSGGSLYSLVDIHEKTDVFHPVILCVDSIGELVSNEGFELVSHTVHERPFHPGLGRKRHDFLISRSNRPFID